MRAPHAILIDLDDTIIDFGSRAPACWRRLCSEVALEQADLDAAELYDAIDAVRSWYWSDPERHRIGRADLHAASAWIVGEALRRLGHERFQLAQEMTRRYREARWASIELIPGALATLERWRTEGLPLALVTNGTSVEQRAKIERFGLARFFDHIQIEGELGRGKPEPEVYHAALSALGCEAGDAWFIGDNLEWDVAAPQRLGLFGIWVDAQGNGVPADRNVTPNHIVRSIAQLG